MVNGFVHVSLCSMVFQLCSIVANHWSSDGFSTIGPNAFIMVFGPPTIAPNDFSIGANHWSNDVMVTIHRYGLDGAQGCLSFLSFVTGSLKLYCYGGTKWASDAYLLMLGQLDQNVVCSVGDIVG